MKYITPNIFHSLIQSSNQSINQLSVTPNPLLGFFFRFIFLCASRRCSRFRFPSTSSYLKWRSKYTPSMSSSSSSSAAIPNNLASSSKSSSSLPPLPPPPNVRTSPPSSSSPTEYSYSTSLSASSSPLAIALSSSSSASLSLSLCCCFRLCLSMYSWFSSSFFFPCDTLTARPFSILPFTVSMHTVAYIGSTNMQNPYPLLLPVFHSLITFAELTTTRLCPVCSRTKLYSSSSSTSYGRFPMNTLHGST
mmetsp:Transcript_9508/g.27117  ORF Transcript_9508/g.27117 Transcript_9508/m.27117 type:complete len:249 (+) Transcript_9508:119-865(+)